jgi:hypothetical protein
LRDLRKIHPDGQRVLLDRVRGRVQKNNEKKETEQLFTDGNDGASPPDNIPASSPWQAIESFLYSDANNA